MSRVECMLKLPSLDLVFSSNRGELETPAAAHPADGPHPPSSTPPGQHVPKLPPSKGLALVLHVVLTCCKRRLHLHQRHHPLTLTFPPCSLAAAGKPPGQEPPQQQPVGPQRPAQHLLGPQLHRLHVRLLPLRLPSLRCRQAEVRRHGPAPRRWATR